MNVGRIIWPVVEVQIILQPSYNAALYESNAGYTGHREELRGKKMSLWSASVSE